MAIKKRIIRRRRQQNKNKTAGSMSRGSLVKLIKSVSLRSQETKMATTDSTVLPLLHNISTLVRSNLMATSQGVTDSLGITNRIGDTVTPVGVKLYLTMRQPADRPNVTFKIWIVRIIGAATVPTFVPVKTITGNLLMDPIDTEKCTLVKSFKFKSKNNYWQGALASSRENTNFQNIYIPLPRKPYVYSADGGPNGKNYQLSMYVAAYDTFGTLITDNIASFACSQSFYFKDS